VSSIANKVKFDWYILMDNRSEIARAYQVYVRVISVGIIRQKKPTLQGDDLQAPNHHKIRRR